jgi:predicted DNA binding CopG/RHH family protein
MKLKEVMAEAKKTGKRQRVDEGERATEVKVSVTLRLDLETLNKIKAEGEEKAIPYQTLINSILKQHATIGGLESRIEALEKKFDKRG